MPTVSVFFLLTALQIDTELTSLSLSLNLSASLFGESFAEQTKMAAEQTQPENRNAAVPNPAYQKSIEDFDPPKKPKRNKFAFACAILASMTSVLLGYGTLRKHHPQAIYFGTRL